MYCKIQALLKTFTAPVVCDNTKSIADETNLRALEDAVPLFPGSDFQKHLFDCEEHALMTERELKSAKKVMYSYIVTVGKALEKRFPDMEFIIKNTAFLDPTLRSFQQPNMQALTDRFNTDIVTHFNMIPVL